MCVEKVHNIKGTGIPCTIPNVLSLSRICISPFLVVTAAAGAPRAFLVIFALCLVTDFLDGQLARVLKQITLIGTRLDTLGDVIMYSSATVGGWMLWTEELGRYSILIISSIAAMIIAGLFSRLKHGRLPAYHTWLGKSASAALGVCSFLMFAGIAEMPFRYAVILLIASSVEEVVITSILPEAHDNIRSIYHAVRERRMMKGNK